MRSIIAAAVLLISISASGQSKHAVHPADFVSAEGYWKGTLTYLDYSSGKPYSMPASITLSTNKTGEIYFSFVYPDEPKANSKDTLKITKNGLEFDGATVTSKMRKEDGSLIIITDRDGFDGNDNKKAVIRHVYTIGNTIFNNRKEVKFEGTDKWILRNEYAFTR